MVQHIPYLEPIAAGAMPSATVAVPPATANVGKSSPATTAASHAVTAPRAAIAPAPDATSWSTSKRIGVVCLGAGVLGWGVGGALAFKGYQESGHSQHAETYGNWATGLAIGGGAGVATGIALLLFGDNVSADRVALLQGWSVSVAASGSQMTFHQSF